ncbi:hypothetical protein QBC43DRAFT_289940 [Cladorrhinum sp. PSN259]|nr:hypothetical protein QBC43DRAFT_289940 [Cladorrhinum sp. PSN259]
MRLIDVHTKRLKKFHQDPTEPYAILSHTWRHNEEDELSYEDVQNLDNCDRSKKEKLERTCEQAQKDGIHYAWIDTCCIDKKSAVELSEAINSMFRWYQKSAICYAYLSDVELGQPDAIAKSRWFTRGWTLQELLAPPKVAFFDASWNRLGNKSSLSHSIMEATGIPHDILTGIKSLEACSVAQRMSWASRRTTTRHEDMAYCLLGIFDVRISPIYGEGLKDAFGRLQEAIMKRTPDDSIMAWSLGTVTEPGRRTHTSPPLVSCGVLATSPSAFDRCGDIVQQSRDFSGRCIQNSTGIFGGIMGLRISLVDGPPPPKRPSLQPSPENIVYGLLSCGPRNSPSYAAAVPLILETSTSGVNQVFFRPHGLDTVCIPKPSAIPPPRDIMVRTDRVNAIDPSDDKSYWLYLRPEPRYPWNARIDEVYPAESFESEMAMIRPPSEQDFETNQRLFLVRFHYTLPMSEANPETTGYFILALEYFRQSTTGHREPKPYLYVDNNPPTPLSTVPALWTSLACSGVKAICNVAGPSSFLRVCIKKENIGRYWLWVVKLSCDPSEKRSIYSTRPPIGTQMRLRTDCRDFVRLIWDLATESEQCRTHIDELNSRQQERQRTKHEIDVINREIGNLTDLLNSLGHLLKDQEGIVRAVHAAAGRLVSRTAYLRTLVEERERSPNITHLWHPDSGIRAIAPKPCQKEVDGAIRYLLQWCPNEMLRVMDETNWVPGITLLMFAASTGNASFIRQIVRYDSDIRFQDSRGRNAVDWAIAGGIGESQFLQLLKAQRDSPLQATLLSFDLEQIPEAIVSEEQQPPEPPPSQSTSEPSTLQKQVRLDSQHQELVTLEHRSSQASVADSALPKKPAKKPAKKPEVDEYVLELSASADSSLPSHKSKWSKQLAGNLVGFCGKRNKPPFTIHSSTIKSTKATKSIRWTTAHIANTISRFNLSGQY